MYMTKRLYRTIASLSVIAVLVLPYTSSAAGSKVSKKPVPYGAPVELRIPRLGVKANVEKTSIDRKGELEAPKGPKQVGWYRNGTIPGKRGNAVISGHVDWYTGPAIFRNLGALRKGDVVEVINDYGTTLRFRVTGRGTYHNGETPLELIVGRSSGFHLNLYTCGGRFNRSQRDYSQRIVVFTELIR